MADRITIPTVDFANAISAIQKFVPKATPIPPLLNIHFHLKKDSLSLTASDALAMASATIPLELPFEFSEFAVLVDADKLIKFILSLDTDNVSIHPNWDYENPSFGNNKLVLKSGRRRTTLNTMSASEYIRINFDRPERVMDIDVGTFTNAVKLVSRYHLPSNDSKLTIYRGIELAISNHDAFMLSATDSFVGAIYAYGDPGNSGKMVVVGDQLLEVVKSLEDCDSITLGIPSDADTKMFIYGTVGGVEVEFAIQMLANKEDFVDLLGYFTGLFEQNLSSLVFDREDMLNALKPVEAYEDIYVTIFIKENSNTLHISSEDEHVGEYDAEVDCIDIENLHADLVWRMNKKFLVRALKNIKSNAKFMTNNSIPLVFVLEYLDDPDEIVDDPDIDFTYYQGIGKITL